MSLSGKVALVTGAAQGLGKAFSEALLAKGAKVFLADIQRLKGEETTAQFQKRYGQDQAYFFKFDVSSSSEWTYKLKSSYGRLDIVVNNAGIVNEQDPLRTVDVNVKGTILGTSMAIDFLSKNKGDQAKCLVINIASTAGLTSEAYFVPSYTATKRAVVGYTQSMAHNPYLQKKGLSFACLCPAFTDTEILDSSRTLYPNDCEAAVQAVGINEISDVVKGFMQLVESENCNGAVMSITKQAGIQFHQKPIAKSKV